MYTQYLSLTSKDGNMKKLLEIHSKFKMQYMYDLHRCELMTSLDDVLAMEIQSCFGPSFSFESFKIVSPEDCPRQPNFYDCGLFVCIFMDGRSDATSRKFENIVMFNSVAECLFLARQLATFPTNQIRSQLKKNAFEYTDMQTGQLNPVGKKRQAPPLKKDSRAKLVKTLS
ncbi:hypothetical protein Dsin_012633 [Dipteronia sinensis]|uniref:Ubiquitin-like protease family profile domain-containing protein n=1 Tax=Dipteronia sinensis TaxID=43782 RepID=A0AAE0E849_9ROSI|nr:hypothetical protein Dsin_012633 [Dipteronia sinensis]